MSQAVPISSTPLIDRLQADRHELELLSNLVPEFVLRPTNLDSDSPDAYVASIGLRSVIGISRSGIPIGKTGFEIRIKLPPSYPQGARAVCQISPAPYHPHFKRKILGRSAMWIDFQLQDEGLGLVILRLLHSLQYDPAYISEQAPKIGNHIALAWYKWLSGVAHDAFPIDKNALPTSLNAEILSSVNSDIGEDNAAFKKVFKIENGAPSDPMGADIVQSRRVFQIETSHRGYEPETGQNPMFFIVGQSNSRRPNRIHKLYLLPSASEKIFEHIGWERDTTKNQNEQGGILLGRVIIVENEHLTYGVVEEAVPGELAIGTGAYLKMDHNTWKEMIDRVDEMLEANPDRKLQVIGWYHTHPNNLDVFMSGTDEGTQKRLFAQDWQFAVVLNPHRKIWRVFHGGDCEECQGYLAKYKVTT